MREEMCRLRDAKEARARLEDKAKREAQKRAVCSPLGLISHGLPLSTGLSRECGSVRWQARLAEIKRRKEQLRQRAVDEALLAQEMEARRCECAAAEMSRRKEAAQERSA